MANNIEKQLKEISERLEQGVKEIFTSERYTEYLNTMSKFHNYSFNNTLLITMQKPEATLVAGYQAWQKKFNRHVKRGEKGIQIIAPAPIREKQEIEKIDPVTKEPVIGDDGQPETEIVEMVIPRFRVTTVFDVSQTEGEPIAELEVNGQKFLQGGDRLKVTIRFRGREMAHTNIGEQLLRDFAAKCADIANLDKQPKLEGRNMSMFLSPKPQNTNNKK